MDYIGFKGLAEHTTQREPIEMQDSSAHLSLVGGKWVGMPSAMDDMSKVWVGTCGRQNFYCRQFAHKSNRMRSLQQREIPRHASG